MRDVQMVSRPRFAGLCAMALVVFGGCGGDAKPRDTDVGGPDATDTGGDVEADTAGPDLLLHVPSPDWSEQIVYFVMLDRFDNGDPRNDDQGAGEYDPTRPSHYSGGDIQGVIDRLDYIQGLGATAVWITPPVKNQWWDPLAAFSGYHGYWARDLSGVDEHYGDLATYQALSDALHRRGMVLIQDIVPNHMGNFFTYDATWDPNDPTRGYIANTGSLPTTAPTMAPFDQNDPRRAADLAAKIYHWTPPIADFNDPEQETSWQVSDLDDLDTGNPVVRAALKKAYSDWIVNVGVDGFRVDTVKYVEHEFWRDFMHGTDPLEPGIHAVAATTGRDDFFAFGEVYETSPAFADTGEKKLSSFLGTATEPELDAVLSFPLFQELREVIGGGRATSALRYRLDRMVDASLFPDWARTPNFIDNHDVQRFLAAASQDAFEQALVLLFTLPGIPIIYQGTEQGFTETRASMFAGGFGSGGRDHFDTASNGYVFVKELAAMRKARPVLRRGTLTVLTDSPNGPGLFAFERTLGDDEVVVLLNTAEEKVLVSDLDVDLAGGAKLAALFSRRAGEGAAVTVGHGDRLLLELDARAVLVLGKTAETVTLPPAPATITVDTPLAGQTFSEDVVVTGRVTPANTKLVMVLDDLLDRARDVTVAADGTWSVTLPISSLPYGDNPHTVVFYAAEAGVASARAPFTSSTVFDGQLVSLADPAGDDKGPAGTYTYPQDTTFAGGHYGDIVKLTLEASGSTLRVKLQMASHSTVWNPTNGFDHVSFNIYVDLPGLDGVSVLPKLQASAPDGFAWDLSTFAFGWSNTLYKPAGATATEWGSPSPGRPKISVDAPGKTITFEYNGAQSGVTTWEGASVYVTTWDFDGIDNVLRPLSPGGGQWAFGGGEATDPLILDDVGPLLIPAAE